MWAYASSFCGFCVIGENYFCNHLSSYLRNRFDTVGNMFSYWTLWHSMNSLRNEEIVHFHLGFDEQDNDHRYNQTRALERKTRCRNNIINNYFSSSSAWPCRQATKQQQHATVSMAGGWCESHSQTRTVSLSIHAIAIYFNMCTVSYGLFTSAYSYHNTWTFTLRDVRERLWEFCGASCFRDRSAHRSTKELNRSSTNALSTWWFFTQTFYFVVYDPEQFMPMEAGSL